MAFERRSSAQRPRLFSASSIRYALCLLAWIAALSTVLGPATLRATAHVAGARPAGITATVEAALHEAVLPEVALQEAALHEAVTSELERGLEGATDAAPDVIEDEGIGLPSLRDGGDLGRRSVARRGALAAPGDPERAVHTRPPAIA